MTDAIFTTCAFGLLVLAGLLGGFTAPPSFTVGDRVTYLEDTGERTCGVLSGIHEGRAWILPDRSPNRYATRPLSELEWGCRAS